MLGQYFCILGILLVVHAPLRGPLALLGLKMAEVSETSKISWPDCCLHKEQVNECSAPFSPPLPPLLL